MKIALAQTQWLDNQGYPLVAGRVSVYLHESDTPAPVYTLEGDQYTEAQNPFILDEGGRCPTGSIWFDATVVDVKVEAYNGVPGSYTQIDRYEDGFEVPGVTNDTVVTGMEGLASANPELGVVTVVGYNNAHDCEARQFVWDGNCTVNEDGGAIVASTTSENGRWILLSDSRYMPSSYYGIRGGSAESNISAFLTYPETVGRWSIKLPPVPRFEKGTYTSSGWTSTPKTIAFDAGAKFTQMSFMCRGAEVTPGVDYVADFQFSAQDIAESRWFRTAKQFWKCDANELHQSRTNYFADNNLGNYGTICAILLNKRISGPAMTVTGAANLEFNHCNIGDYALSTNWYTVFKNCDFTDRWFNDGNWDFGVNVTHRQLVRSTENRITIDHFADANVFVLQQAANSIPALDLQNRVVSGITGDMPFTLIRNAVIDYAHFNHNITLENCAINHLYLEHNYLKLTTKNCNCVIEHCQVGEWNDNRSSFSLNTDINTYFATLSWVETGIDLNGHFIGRTEDDLIHQNNIVFWRCTMSNGTIASSNPIFLECNIANTPIYVFPCSIFENVRQTWSMSMEFRDNRFNGSSCLNIGGHNGHSDHLGEVFEVRLDAMSITDNVFNTTVSGVNCPFWAGPSLSYRFLRGMTTYVAGSDPSVRTVEYFPIRYEYRGNDGNCPRQYGGATASDLPGAWAIAANWGTGGTRSGMYFEQGQMAYRVFCLPALVNENFEPIPDPTVGSSVFSVDRRSVCVPYRMKAIFSANQSGGGCADYPVSGYLPLCAADKSLPNDMFSVYVGSWGETAQFFGVNPLPSGE